MVGAKTSEARR